MFWKRADARCETWRGWARWRLCSRGAGIRRVARPASRSMEALPTEKVSELKAHVGPVLAVRFNKDGNYCLTCGQDRLIKLWNPSKGLVVKTYVGHGHEVCSRIPSTPPCEHQS